MPYITLGFVSSSDIYKGKIDELLTFSISGRSGSQWSLLDFQVYRFSSISLISFDFSFISVGVPCILIDFIVISFFLLLFCCFLLLSYRCLLLLNHDFICGSDF